MRYGIWALFLISAPLYATPSISVITGTTTHGTPLVISGSNFTTYSTTTGTFDTFESGSFSPYWAFTNDLTLPGSDQRNSFSSVNAKAVITSGSNDHAQFQGAGTTSRSWYISFWWKLDPNWKWGTTDHSGTNKWLSNIKLIRMWNPGPRLENSYMAFAGWQGTLMYLKEGYSSSNTETLFLHVGPARLTLNTWHQFRMQYVDSSALHAADGSVKIYFDTMTILNEINEVFKDNEDFNKRPQAVGFDNVWGCTEATPDVDGCEPGTVWLDNVYAVDSIARVEICDNPVYTSCTIPPEIQPVTAWNPTSITVTYNSGSLPVNQYLFVIDNTGTASAGFAMTGTGSGGGGGETGGSGTGLRGNGHLNGKGRLQ